MTTLPSTEELGLWQAEPHIVMHHLMNLLEQSDADMAATLGLSRQAVYNRRTGRSTMTSADIKQVALALGVDPRLFLGTAAEAIMWVIRRTDPNPDGGDKLRPNADVVQWDLLGIPTRAKGPTADLAEAA